MAQLVVVMFALFGQRERTYTVELAAHVRHLQDSGHFIAEIVARTGITRSSHDRHLPPRLPDGVTADGGP